MKEKMMIVELQAEMTKINDELVGLECATWDSEVDQGPSPVERRMVLYERRAKIILLIRNRMTQGSHEVVLCTPPPLDWTLAEQVVHCPVLILGQSRFYRDPWGVDRAIPMQVEIVESPHLRTKPLDLRVSACPNEVGSVMFAHPPMAGNPPSDPGLKRWIEREFRMVQSLKPII